MSEAEAERRAALTAGELDRAAAAEVALLAGMLGAQFGTAHVEAEQGLIMVQVSAAVHVMCRRLPDRQLHLPEMHAIGCAGR